MVDVTEASKLYIALHHLISNTTSTLQLQNQLKKLIPIIKSRNLDKNSDLDPSELNHEILVLSISQVVELLLIYLPETIDPFESLSIGCYILEEFLLEDSSSDEVVPETEEVLNSIIGENPGLKYLIGYDDIKAKERASSLFRIVQEQSHSIGWSIEQDEQIYSPNLFFHYVKSRTFKVNNLIPDMLITDKSLDQLGSFSLTSEKLLAWVNGFYKPLSILSLSTRVPKLSQWDEESEPDKLSFILQSVIASSNINVIIDKTLVPHLKYNQNSWLYFIHWLQQYGDEKIINKQLTRQQIQENLQILTELLTNENLLTSIRQVGDSAVLGQFVTTVLSIIYMIPIVSLKIFINMKECLVLLKTLQLPEGEPIDMNFELVNGSSIKETSEQIVSPPTNSMIEYIKKLVQTGERLYANELSLTEVYQLSQADKTKQLKELDTFIANETKYSSKSNSNSLRQWSNILSSIYWIFSNTFVFSKIESKELDAIILSKLLNLNLFEITHQLFKTEFMKSLSIKSYNQSIYEKALNEFNMATNCDPKLGHLEICNKCLNLIDTGDDSSNGLVNKLRLLISSCQDLLNFKIYFQQGVPLIPKKITEIEDPLQIITRILELNPKSYLQVDFLYQLLCKLIKGLNTENLEFDKSEIYRNVFDSNNDGTIDEKSPLYIKLKLISINYASSQDFEYSYLESVKLLDLAFELSNATEASAKVSNDLIRSEWFTFLQISKNDFFDEEGNEVQANLSNLPTNIRNKYNSILNNQDPNQLSNLMKLEILSKLLLIVPTEFNSNVIDQWKMINQTQQLYAQEQVEMHTPLPQQQYQQHPSHAQANPQETLQDKLQRSLNSAAFEVFNPANAANTDVAEIGKNIVGWVIGAT